MLASLTTEGQASTMYTPLGHAGTSPACVAHSRVEALAGADTLVIKLG